MEKSERLQARISPETTTKIRELARIWGPVEKLTPSAVVRRCVELAYRAETGKKVCAKNGKT